MYLAFKEIFKDKLKSLMISSIIFLISYLIFFLSGLAYGLANENKSAVDAWNSNSILLSEGSDANIFASRIEKSNVDNLISSNTSMVSVVRLIGNLDGSRSEENTVRLVLMAMDTHSKAFPKVLEGNKPKEDNEVVASMSLKELENLKLGDTFTINNSNKNIKIVGFTEDLKFNISPVIYGKEDISIVQDSFESNILSAIIVHDETKIKNINGISQININDYIQKLPGYKAQVLTFTLMIGFLILISAIVLAVFMFIMTIQKKSVFGVMKVQGISTRYLSKSVLIQTLLFSTSSVILAILITYISSVFLPSGVPFQFSSLICFLIGLIIIFVSLLGSIFSVISVSKVDPLDVI